MDRHVLDDVVYALKGEELLAMGPSTMPVWRPVLTSFDILAPLLDALGIMRLTRANFRRRRRQRVAWLKWRSYVWSSRAIALLLQGMVRADHALLDSLPVDWDDLLAAHVVVDPELSIVADLGGGRGTLAISRTGLRFHPSAPGEDHQAPTP